MWVLAVTTIRIAVILLYIHIFPSRRFRQICVGVIGLNLLFLVSTILAECLICRPISYHWDLAIVGASCGNEQALALYTAGLNLLQDVVVVFLPMPVLWGLQLAPHKKFGVTLMFGVGVAYGIGPFSNHISMGMNLILITLLSIQDLRRYQLPGLCSVHHYRS